MKNAIIGILGGILILYMTVIELSIYSRNVRENELNCVVAAVMKQTLENHYEMNQIQHQKEVQSDEEIAQILCQELTKRFGSESDVEIDVKACNMRMGVISVEIEETFSYPNGKQGSVQLEKTLIMDRAVHENELATVTFYLKGDVYKQYEITVGEKAMMPNVEEPGFQGWARKGTTEVLEPAEYGPIEQDMEYEAVIDDI